MNHKRLAGAAVVALVGLGLFGAVTPATAEPSDTAQITINGETIPNHTYVAYLLATYDNVQTDAGSVTGFDLVTDPAVKAAITQVVAARDSAYDATQQAAVDPLQWVSTFWQSDSSGRAVAWTDATSAGDTVRALANDLAQQIESGALQVPSSVQAAASNDKVTLDVTEGLWLVLETTGSHTSATTNSLPVIMGTPFMDGATALNGGPSGQIDIKGDVVSIDKDIVNAIDAQPEGFDGAANMATGSEVEDVWTATTGDSVGFVIRTNVPFYPDSYVDPVFQINDSWTAGLSAPTGVVVKADGATLVLGADYTYTAEANNGTFTITLVNPAAQGGKDILVEYSSTVTAAGTTVTRDTNGASVEFTNNWWLVNGGTDGKGGPTTDETTTDTVDVYTFPLNVIKADLTARGTYLAATFTVKDADGKQVGTITTDGTSAGGFVTGSDGKAASLAGNAWYQVEESVVPVGYTPLNTTVAKFWVYISAGLTEGQAADAVAPVYRYADSSSADISQGNAALSTYVDPVVATGDDANDADVLVLNAKTSSDMPQTGGQILLWVTVAGVLGLGAAGFAVAGVRKSRTRSAHTA